MHVRADDFYFELPKEYIAQTPLRERDSCKLCVYDKAQKAITNDTFHNITQYLNPGDCLVINETKVLPARFFGVKSTMRM